MLVSMGIAMCTIASANQEVKHVHDDKVGYTKSYKRNMDTQGPSSNLV